MEKEAARAGLGEMRRDGAGKKENAAPFFAAEGGRLIFFKKEATIEKIKNCALRPGGLLGGRRSLLGRPGGGGALPQLRVRVCAGSTGREEGQKAAPIACARVCGCGRPFRPMRQWPMRLAQQRKRRGRAGVGACARMARQMPHTGAGAAGVCAPEPPCSHRGMPCAHAFALRGGGVPE